MLDWTRRDGTGHDKMRQDVMTNITPTFQRLIETQELQRAADKLQKGETIPTERVLRILGRDLSRARGLVNTVVRNSLKQNRVLVFHPKRLGGLRYLTDEEALELSGTQIKGATNKFRSGARTVASTDAEQLSSEQRLQHALHGTLAAMHLSLSQREKDVAKLVDKSKATQPLPSLESLRKLFGNGTKRD